MRTFLITIMVLLGLASCQRRQLIRIKRNVTPEQGEQFGSFEEPAEEQKLEAEPTDVKIKDVESEPTAASPESANPPEENAPPAGEEKTGEDHDPLEITVQAPTQHSAEGRKLYDEANELAKKDLEAAKKLYLESCQLGYFPACHRYGWHLQNAGSPANAMQFYLVACQNRVLKSCNNLGWQAEKEGRFEDAKKFYSISCQEKHPGACTNLKRIEEKSTQSSTD